MFLHNINITALCIVNSQLHRDRFHADSDPMLLFGDDKLLLINSTSRTTRVWNVFGVNVAFILKLTFPVSLFYWNRKQNPWSRPDIGKVRLHPVHCLQAALPSQHAFPQASFCPQKNLHGRFPNICRVPVISYQV